MKKIMYIAVALLVLVGCQKSQEAKENAPVNYGTITGKIKLPQGPNKISAREGLQSEGDIQMQWEEGDEILIGNEKGESNFLTLKSIDGNGVATFEGVLLNDMSSYVVFYGFNPFDFKTNIDVPYIEGNYRPFAMGYGTDESFTIEEFSPVFGMPLKGTAALTEIKASYTVIESYNLTMTFETPLQLSSTSQIVYFPIFSNFVTEPLTFKFYDANGLILTKTIEEATCEPNQVITFTSDLEVNGTAQTEDPKSIFTDKAAMKICFYDPAVGGDCSFTYVYHTDNTTFTVSEIIIAGVDQTETFKNMFSVVKGEGNKFTFHYPNPDSYVNFDAGVTPKATWIFSDIGFQNTDLTHLYVNGVDIIDQIEVINLSKQD